MRILTKGFLALVLLSVAVACGAMTQTMTDAERQELIRQQDLEDQARLAEKRRLEEEKRLEESLTIKKLIIPKDTKFIPGVEQEAQLVFRDGVIALYQSPPDYDKAEASFKKAISVDEGFAEAYFNLGMTYERQGDYDGALKVYDDFAKDNADNLDAKGYVAKVYMVRAKKAKGLGKDAEFTRYAGKAKKISTEILAKNAENATANNAMALYYVMHGNLERAGEYVKAVLTVEPANVTALTTRGLIFIDQNKLSLARWTFEQKVLVQDPNATEALNNLGIVYHRMENIPAAVKSFKKAIKVDADNLEARLNYGAILLNYLNYTAAEAQYTYVLKQQPDNIEAVVGLGSCYYGQRRFDDAIQKYEAAYAADKRKIELLERVGFLHEAFLNQIPTALDYYRRYIRLAKLPGTSNLAMKVKLLDQMWKEMEEEKRKAQQKKPVPGGTPAPGVVPDGAESPLPGPGEPAVAPVAPAAPVADPTAPEKPVAAPAAPEKPAAAPAAPTKPVVDAAPSAAGAK